MNASENTTAADTRATPEHPNRAENPIVSQPSVPITDRHVFVEVSNTLAVPYITGFQRHTRELLARLPQGTDPGAIHFTPVRWCQECNAYRKLTGAEQRALGRFAPPAPVPQSRLGAIAAPLPESLKMALRRMIHHPRGKSLREHLAAVRRRRNHPPEHSQLRISSWPADSWFFDLEAAWHNQPPRSEILPRLRREGVRTATLIADVMPVQFTEWFDEGQQRLFKTFFDAHLEYSDKFISISECSLRDAIHYAESIGMKRPTDTAVITMGANFRRNESPPRPAIAPPGRYLLTVGTVEPRKNHALLLDAFEELSELSDDLSAVMVGKLGWMTESVAERIETHPLFGTRVFWFQKVDDTLLDGLYAHAFLAVQPAKYEGFGTPVIEALSHGVPTLSSHGGALTEAGGEWAEYFDPTSVQELVDLVTLHLNDSEHHDASRSRLAGYMPPSWEDGAEGILAAFQRDLTE